MPNCFGQITTREVQEIRRLARRGMKTTDIAAIIGCSNDRVLEYSGSLVSRIRRAAQYDRIARQAAAYVPTFGGGQ